LSDYLMTPDETQNPAEEPEKRDTLLVALIAEPTIAKAASAAGVSRSTAMRWLREPDFRARYREARATAVEGAIATLQARLSVASEALCSIAGNKKAGHMARIAASRAMFEYAVKGVELLDMETRLAELESRLREKNNP
jgi:hypothetical protein